MSLFKISRGRLADFNTEKAPLHDGYAWFTTDDAGFYIDHEETQVDESTQESSTTIVRSRINEAENTSLTSNYYSNDSNVKEALERLSKMILGLDYDSQTESLIMHSAILNLSLDNEDLSLGSSEAATYNSSTESLDMIFTDLTDLY